MTLVKECGIVEELCYVPLKLHIADVHVFCGSFLLLKKSTIKVTFYTSDFDYKGL